MLNLVFEGKDGRKPLQDHIWLKSPRRELSNHVWVYGANQPSFPSNRSWNAVGVFYASSDQIVL